MLWYKLIGAFIILLVALIPCAGAATYRVELTDISQDAHLDANYLQSAYDFGTRFREIDSVSLELLMPSGYGAAVTTGNSTYSSILSLVIHDNEYDPSISQDYPIGLFSFPRVIQTLEAQQVHYVASHALINANRKASIEFAPYANVENCPTGLCIFPPGGVLDVEYFWPSFLHTGRGNVTLQGSFFHSFHPIGGDRSNYSSMSGLEKPPAVEVAALIIEATAVPEPQSFLLCMSAIVTLLSVRTDFLSFHSLGESRRGT